MSKINQLTDYMQENNLSMVFTDNPDTVAYYTNYFSDPHERLLALVVFLDETVLLVPKLEENESRELSSADRVIGYKDEENPWQALQQIIKAQNVLVESVGIETDQLVVDRYYKLRGLLPAAVFHSITSEIQNQKVIKTTEEIDIMHEAGKLADRALEVGMSTLRTGVTETEVVAAIEYDMKKQGVSDMSFDTMVLFGDHAASPHGTPGDRQLKPGELVLFDLGVVWKGYTSDVTRTVAYGDVDDDIKEIYSVVLKAQLSAQDNVRPGMTAEKLDESARNVIEEAGHGDYFTHRLGHGLGQSVHEYPNISPGSETVLKSGMCFSIEPGIYIENKAGIRIEDCVTLTDKGAVSFTSTSKEWTVIPVK
ncbi:MAG: aminopeptidase P family protein [Alkalibacterium sp.]|nr:aminopeptidase P family protein [Alkalibacterium sp.]